MLQMFVTILTAGWVKLLKALLLLGGICKIQAYWPGAVVTTITTILVWHKCNRQHRWLDITVANMNTSTGPVK